MRDDRFGREIARNLDAHRRAARRQRRIVFTVMLLIWAAAAGAIAAAVLHPDAIGRWAGRLAAAFEVAA